MTKDQRVNTRDTLWFFNIYIYTYLHLHLYIIYIYDVLWLGSFFMYIYMYMKYGPYQPVCRDCATCFSQCCICLFRFCEFMISSKLREIDGWNWLHMWVIGCRLLFFGKSRVRNSQWFWGQPIDPFNHSDAGLRWVDAESLRIKEGKFIFDFKRCPLFKWVYMYENISMVANKQSSNPGSFI